MIDEYRKDIEGAEVSSIREFRIIDKFGNIKWLQFTSAPMEWEGEPASLAILHDITDRKIDTRVEMDMCQPMGVATWQTGGAVRNIHMRKLPD